MPFNEVTIEGTYQYPQSNTPAAGTIDFLLTGSMDDDQAIVVPKLLTATLDVHGQIKTANGQPFRLLSTNRPATEPIYRRYQVTEKITSAPQGRTYQLEVPYDAPPSNAYISFPGVAGSYLSAPDTPGLSIVGDIDIRWAGAPSIPTEPPSTVGGGAVTLMAKAVSAGNQLSWVFFLDKSGRMWFFWSENGVNWRYTLASSANVTPPDGTLRVLRVTLDVNDGTGAAVCRFYQKTTYTSGHIYAYLDDNSGWVEVGAGQGTGVVTSIFDSTAELEVGSYNAGTGGEILQGRYYGHAIKNGINGTLVTLVGLNDLAGGYGGSFGTGEGGGPNVWAMHGNVYFKPYAAAAIDLAVVGPDA